MSVGKKIWKFVSSMRFAVILLIVLAVACSVGSLVTQGQTYAWYAARYSERTAALIIALGLDDAFHSWWFIVITAFLCLNLLCCNLLRLPELIRRMKRESTPEEALRGGYDVRAEGVADPRSVMRAMAVPAPESAKDGEGREVLFAAKNTIGIWGAWVCHLGIMLLILGFSLGQMTHREYVAYGVPGDTRAIGDTGLALTIDDFRVDLRENDTVEQYTAAITVYDLAGGGESRSAEISVNHPADLFGMRFYQNSTGWAARLDVKKNGEPLQSEVVCAGDYLQVKDFENLIVYFNAFYPDYYRQPGVGPTTLSGSLNNPAYLYSVYYMGEILGMNILLPDETLTIDEYEVTFSEPRNYTLIQIKKDSFTGLAFLGGVVTMLGLFLSFYIQPRRVWAVKDENGTWTVYGACRKGGVLFKEQFRRAAGIMNTGDDLNA